MNLRVQRNITLYLHVVGNKAKIFLCSFSSTEGFFVWTVSEHLWAEKCCLLRKSREQVFTSSPLPGLELVLTIRKDKPQMLCGPFCTS